MLHGTSKQKLLGDDDDCFAHALWSVRTFGGVIEHPEASHAWAWFGLNKPPRSGGWVEADQHGGWTCCVAQGHYGHRAQKLTWLYTVNTKRPQLKWGLCRMMSRLDQGNHSNKERASGRLKEHEKKRLSSMENQSTPKEFKELLISLF